MRGWRGIFGFLGVFGWLSLIATLGGKAGVTFSYTAGVPRLFIELHGMTPQPFGVFFGTNTMGLIGASQIHHRLSHHVRAEHILGVVFSCNAASGVFLMLSVMSEYGGFPLRIVMLFVCLSKAGLISPNLTALPMAPFEKMAGSASVLLGTIQYALGVAAGAAGSLRQSGTGVPVTVVMAGCGL